MKTRIALLVILGLTAQAPAAPRFGIVVHRHVMVKAPEGVRLATDIYLPARNGVVSTRFPAIVERTPYNKDTRWMPS